jgi:RNA polymerase sigma-70 factor, ECF subfamily
VSAFNELVEQYQRLAFNVAYRLLGQVEEAKDVTQDSFLAAFNALESFRGSSFKAWLLRIVMNGSYDTLRKRQRHPTDSLESMLGKSESEARFRSRDPGPESAAMTAETGAAIQMALKKLSMDHQSVIILCDIQSVSYEEAAETLDVSLGTVKSRLSRARALLRDELLLLGELPAASRRPYNEGLART